jgi:hypothetical protein
MACKKISRNDPCPCGSGKKFKNCCLGKGIDWEARKRPPLPAPRPRSAPLVGFAALGPYRVVDARLREMARSVPGQAEWKGLVEVLTDATPFEERVRAYKAIRDAGILPPDAAFFLFGHGIQWIPPEGQTPEEDNEVASEESLDRHTLAMLRRFGLDDMADLYAHDRLEYDRRHERGRQFFYGPPDEGLAERLREKGIIE